MRTASYYRHQVGLLLTWAIATNNPDQATKLSGRARELLSHANFPEDEFQRIFLQSLVEFNDQQTRSKGTDSPQAACAISQGGFAHSVDAGGGAQQMDSPIAGSAKTIIATAPIKLQRDLPSMRASPRLVPDCSTVSTLRENVSNFEPNNEEVTFNVVRAHERDRTTLWSVAAGGISIVGLLTFALFWLPGHIETGTAAPAPVLVEPKLDRAGPAIRTVYPDAAQPTKALPPGPPLDILPPAEPLITDIPLPRPRPQQSQLPSIAR
jgi:hypothetical protein